MDVYRGAKYHISPSTGEGSSMMLRETKECGTVITSPVLEEAVADYAVILEDPTAGRKRPGCFGRSSSLRK